MNYILLYPQSNEHLGLFNDLKIISNVEMFLTGFKSINNKLACLIRRFHTNAALNQIFALPFRSVWYQKPTIQIDGNKDYCIIVIDGALRALSAEQLNSLFSKQNVSGVLVLINSLNAQSTAILETKNKMKKIKWDSIYSFDPRDVIKYDIKYLGNCYYSYHDPKKFLNNFPEEKPSEAYFIGGLKGDRKDLIIKVFEKLQRNGITLNFNISISGGERFKPKLYSNRINYYSGGWFPYEKVLSGVYQSDTIVEILQKGQSGPSLRYYEAVCYNKKLLTNNPMIVDLPYYDSRYMKIFKDPSEIDINWIRKKMDVDYYYNGDFSPVYLLKRVLE